MTSPTNDMEKKTLLQKAREAKSKTPYTDSNGELLELVIAWVNGQVTLGQINTAIHGIDKRGNSYNNTLYQVAVVLRDAVKAGKITVKIK